MFAERGCTDLICCGVFLVFWLAMIIIAGIGFTQGDPLLLTHMYDMGSF